MMMAVADRHGQGVGGVRRSHGTAGQQPRDHHRNLFLVGMAGSDHRLLDDHRQILRHRQAAQRRRQQGNAAGHAELEGGGRVLVRQGHLDRRGVRRMGRHHRSDAAMKLQQPLGEFGAGVGDDNAVG